MNIYHLIILYIISRFKRIQIGIIIMKNCIDKSHLRILEREFFSGKSLKEEKVQEALRSIHSSVSDSLLTPLTVIQIALEYLLLTEYEISDAERKKIIKIAFIHSKRLEEKIHTLLNYMKG